MANQHCHSTIFGVDIKRVRYGDILTVVVGYSHGVGNSRNIDDIVARKHVHR